MAELRDLLVSGRDMDEALLTSVLKPLIAIDEESCEIRPKAGWRKASNDAKVLAYLVARKAMRALSVGLAGEGQHQTSYPLRRLQPRPDCSYTERLWVAR